MFQNTKNHDKVGVRIKVALMSYAMDNRIAKGTALYTRKLLEGLLEDDSFEFYLVHYEKTNDPLYTKAHEIIMPKVRLPYASKFVSQLLFFWKYRNDGFDIIHWFQPRLYPFYSFAPAKKIIVTMHGAGDITAPTAFVFSRFVFNLVLKYFHRQVTVAIVDSESAKSEVVKHYGFYPNNVKSIYLGGGENYVPMAKDEAREIVSHKYKIQGSYVLNISRLQPHKNVCRLIEAYSLLRKNNKDIKEKLVIVGKPVNSHPEEYKTAKASQFSNDILFIDYVDSEDLNAVYSAAEVFVFPSLSEGFGLPVLEAMASGAPVVTSNIDSMPEIGGDAVITTDPYDILALSVSMKKVLDDSSLKEKMIESGLERTKHFSWKKMAEETKDLYKQDYSRCYFCESFSDAPIIETHVSDAVEYSLHHCQKCGVEYWTPFKNPGAEWYEKDLRYASRNIDPEIEPNWHQKKTINFLGPRMGRLLDVACGAGTFLYWARKKGWGVSGIDFDRDAIRTAKEVFKLDNVYDVDLTQYIKDHPESKFDLVSLFDIFEHIDNHKEFLREVGAVLLPKGYIAISSPYRYGARWLMGDDFPPRHLTRWDRRSITRYLDEQGFKVVYIKRMSEGVGFLVTKVRRKYGEYFSMNLIGKMKSKARKEGKIDLDSPEEKNISRVHKLARVKDWLVFGLPAVFLWLGLFFSQKCYITLFVIAQKK